MTTPDLQALLALQELDSRADQERHRRAHLPQRAELDELRRLVADRSGARGEISVALGEVSGRQQAAERELRATEDRIAVVNARLYGGMVSASRELQAMAAEVASLRKRASDLEDKVIGLLEEREPLDRALSVLDKQLGELDEHCRELETALWSAEADVDAVVVELEAQRAAVIGPVPAPLLAAYDKLRARLGGVAVARLVGGRCDGCHLSLPAMELDRIRHEAPGTLEHCEQCGRILLVPVAG